MKQPSPRAYTSHRFEISRAEGWLQFVTQIGGAGCARSPRDGFSSSARGTLYAVLAFAYGLVL
jgi:hypothetical protein